MKRFIAIALTVAIAWAAWRYVDARRPLVLVADRILTMDDEDRIAEAVLVRDGWIAAVGDADFIREEGGPLARVVDAGGVVLPGFIDAHGHFPGAGLDVVMVDLNAPPIGTVDDLDALLEALRERAAETPKGDWIIGFGYDDTLLAENRHPTRRDLDSVSTDHPIWIHHVSYHLAAGNSRALAAAGITAETQDPEGGVIQREPGTNEPNGVVEERAQELVESLVPQPSPLEQLAIVRAASDRYARAGVTTAQNGYAEKAHMTGLSWMTWLGLVPLRVVAWPKLEVGEEIANGAFDATALEHESFRVGAVKIVADGSIQGYTAHLTAPYFTPFRGDPEYHGYPAIPRSDLIRFVSRFHELDMQLAVHGNGDAEIDDILDALEEAQRRHPREDPRLVVVHAQTARQDQLRRMEQLGATPSFFGLHVWYWGDRHRDVFLGPERAAAISPARTAEAVGLKFSLHCDTPVVPMDPLRAVEVAVSRRTLAGHVLGESERILPMRALRAVTADAAWQMFLEREIGSIEVGKRADLVVLDGDPSARPERASAIRVLRTIVAGRTVYRRSD